MACTRGSKKTRRAAAIKKEDGDGDGGAAATSLRVGGEILWLVLQHLPLRVLFQCKTVCKAWNSVISNPCFRRQYLSDSPGPGQIVVLVDMETSRNHRKRGRDHWRRICSIPRFRFSAEQRQGRILEEICTSTSRCFPASMDLVAVSCGLLLLNNRKLDRYIIYNPLTRTTEELPPAPCRTHMDNLTSFICREPGNGSSSSNSYQFEVVLIPSLSPGSPEIQMYSSRNRLWSIYPVPWVLLCYMSFGQNLSRQVVMGGTVYWAPREQLLGVFDPRTGLVMMLPLLQQRNCSSPCLGKDGSGGLLCCVWDDIGFDVLVFRRDAIGSPTPAADGLWRKLHTVDYLEIAKECSVPIEELNSGGTRMVFVGPYILLATPIHHVVYHMRSGKLSHAPNDSRSLLPQLSTGHIVPSRAPTWPFCLYSTTGA